MKKILIVEDDSMLSEIYKKKFEMEGLFEIFVATSGTDAIGKAKKIIPDLILLDLVLPEMDGFEVIRELRKSKELNETKIIPFSNLSYEDNKKRLDELGTDGFIAKSEHTPQELIMKVEEILNDKNEKREIDSKNKSNQIFKNNQLDILLADNDEFFLNVFGKKLEEAGYNIERAMNGREVLELLNKNDFEVVILGINLLDLKAEEVIAQFRISFPQKKTQFIILNDEDESFTNFEKLKKNGISGIIDKNKINPDQFGDEIKKILS